MKPDRTWTEADFEARQQQIIERGIRQRGPSLADRYAALPASVRAAFEETVAPVEWRRWVHDWRFWARPKQLIALEPTTDYECLLFLAGRGFGKNRMMNETMWERIVTGRAKSICYIGADWKDVRRNMIGGLPDTDSGILDVVPPWVPRQSDHGVKHDKNKNEIYFKPWGCTIYLNTGEDKEQRGGNFTDVWIDEPIKYRYLETVQENLDLALRKGDPLMYYTTTPKNQEWLKELMMDSGTRVVHGVTTENSGNLSEKRLRRWLRRWGGSRVGDQELMARILGDNEHAIASMTSIDEHRLGAVPSLDAVAVGFDPAVSTKRKSDDTGLVAVGKFGNRLALLEDRTGRYSADRWPREGAEMCKQWGARWAVVERNKVGDVGVKVVRDALKAAGLAGKCELVEAYSFKDKWARAQPVSALYDQGRVSHVGRFPELESQLTQWDPSQAGYSPNNLDAFVHAAIQVMDLANVDEPKLGASVLDGMREACEGWEHDRWSSFDRGGRRSI